MMSLLFRLAPYAVVVTAITASLWFFANYVRDQERVTAELRSTRQQLSQAQAALKRAEEIARVHRTYLQQAEAEAERWETLANELRTMEGRDAPLSLFLRSAAERLYGERDATTSGNSAAIHSTRSPAPLPRLPRANSTK